MNESHEMKGPRQMSNTDAVVNRHMARLLSELEAVNCPTIYIEAVKSKLVWMRSDLNEMKGNPTNGNTK